MSWLSSALKRNKLDVLNKIAKPIQAIANPMLDKMPVVGSVKAGAEAVGQMLPPIKAAAPQLGLPGSGPTDVANAGAGGSNVAAILAALGKLPGVSSAADFLKGNSGLNALGVGQGINAALLNQKALEYAKNAEGTAMSQWNKNAPLRDAGRAGMLAPKSSVDTSFLPGIRRAGNPFARVGG